MIYTITMNPAIDYIIETNNFEINKTNYFENGYENIGGKGINVAFVLKELNCDVTAMGFLGKVNSKIFYREFAKQELLSDFIEHKSLTRINFKIKNLSLKQETELNNTGTKIDPNLVDKFLLKLDNILKPNDIVVLSGSTPPQMQNNIYEVIGNICNKKQALFIMDASKINLLSGIKAKPFLIKPNINELCEILNVKVQDFSFAEISSMVDKLKTYGAQNVLLSMGEKGGYYFGNNNSVYKINAATGNLINSVGAGDSMLGGFIFGLVNNLPLDETLKYCSACGAATAFSKGLAKIDKIDYYINKINVERIK
ncbi:1-phosphofructokinase [Spiroplasma endosymbiont of Anurida maritima]|uniref:1-phosphofructokinase n=1 Tax=Spiroplasma endosymbiont of Anurida maritima TaxID=2967972 RepID=UPI0036D42687